MIAVTPEMYRQLLPLLADILNRVTAYSGAMKPEDVPGLPEGVPEQLQSEGIEELAEQADLQATT
ncbi:hypothetical protein C8039_12865 [Halogeometricum sp. wsp3]|nr:hypothetical protein C8039_12865 [Halogeometricum sp. wsp3]